MAGRRMSSIWMGAFAAVVTCGFMAVGCGSSIDASGGAGGMAGAGGGAGTGGTAGAGGAAGTGGTGGEQMVELARLRVSAMQGDEPAEFSSDTLPGLFVLDSRISSASISFVNEASSKGDEGPATFFPALTPAPPASSPGYIQLTVTPVIGQLVSEQRISYTTAALFANNPSSLRLLHSDDAFAEPLSIIQTDQARTEVVEVESTPGDGSFSFRWQAGNDFDEFGGGRAGFTTNDVVIEGVIVEP